MIVFTVMLSSFSFYFYQMFFTPNFMVDREDALIAIPKGTTFKELESRLYKEGYINDMVSFSFLAKVKGLQTSVKPGMYLVKKDMTNSEAVNMFFRGIQTPVKLTFSLSLIHI